MRFHSRFGGFMFFPDFPAFQGVLAVDAASITIANMPESSPASGESLQKSNQLANNLNGNNWFEVNSAAFVVMLLPADAPPPNPH